MRHRSLRFALVFVLLVAVAGTGCKIKMGEGDVAWNSFVADSRHDMDMGGYTLHYIDMGEGDPVVLIHGFADSTYCFNNNLMPLLDAGYRVILIDQPGMGRSLYPPEPYTYSIENQAENILKLIDKLGIDKFALGGSSMGGGITLYLTLNHPERVRCAIVLDPACYSMEKTFLVRAANAPGAKGISETFGGRWAVEVALKDVYYNDDMVDDVIVDEYTRAMTKNGYLPVLMSLAREYWSDAFYDMEKRYSEIQIPMLIVWGDHDKWVSTEFGPRLDKAVPNSVFMSIKDSGHLPHQEQPAIVNPMLIGFLNQNLKSENKENEEESEEQNEAESME